ncbi:MAG: YqaE/Pmp3 family membrane protein [Acidobacteriota bacterium]|nr:YqaE/Pmp3 family membrane protein [Acidobacteriota bacterium]MDH3527980.1 YqaE/Pmp3 family membrane protein [Acidobacteriota bacterium]
MIIVKIILALLLPPIAVAMQVGITTHFWINIILTLIGGVPGVIHALWVIITDQGR